MTATPTAGKPWEGEHDRFDRHWEKMFSLPTTNFPRLINKAIKHLPKLLSKAPSDWKIKTVAGQTAKALLKYHQSGLHNIRKARNQRYHTDIQILSLLFSRVNIQPYNKDFSFLEIRRTPLNDIARETGFSKTCVNDSIARLKKAGLLRTQRNKNKTRDREWVATRWLTVAAFDMLGLSSWLAKQKEGQYIKRRQRSEDIIALDNIDTDSIPKPLRNKLERARRNAIKRPPDKQKQKGAKTT